MNHQIAGRLQLAEPLYREILSAEPGHAAANHCLGMLYVHRQQPAVGLPHLLASLQASPQIPEYWLGYLEALLSSGRLDDATITLALGRQHGLASEAVEEFARRLNARITQLSQTDRPALAAPPLLSTRAERRRASRANRASRASPNAARMERTMLDLVFQGNLAAAGSAARALTERFPDRGSGWKTLGAMQWAEGRLDLALAAMEKSVALLPLDAEALANFGTLLSKLARLDEAESYLDRALAIDPGLATAYPTLGDVYQRQGRNSEAEAAYRRALSLNFGPPNRHEDMRHTSLLFVLSHNPAIDADALFAAHRQVGMAFEAFAPALSIEHRNTRKPERRLKIGIVSADLFNHAIATFIEPVLQNMDRHDGLELTAYYNNVVVDETTDRLRRRFARWRPIITLSDAQLEQQIIDDGIDILIDLSGHTSGNRLRAFARKPAPVQVSWLGYPGTTGLTAMDYYLTDPIFLPPGEFDRYFTEKLVYLHAFAPFQPYAAAPPVNALPALETGSLRFGSFNRLGKITDASIHLWSQLLLALPSATMLLVDAGPEGPHNRLLGRFLANGITSDRLKFHPRCGMDEYLALHHQVDLCLDTTPYTGGTTTCHALWMGVPTLTLAGATPASRQSAANQAMIGLVGFCARSAAEFVERGVYWSTHLAELAEVRAQLRTRWEQTPGRRPDRTAEVLIRALRQMWRRWCAGLPAQSFEIDESRAAELRWPLSTPNP